MIYIIIWFSLTILSFHNRSFDNRTRRLLLYIIFVTLSSLFGFRYCVGSDTINYMRINEDLPTLSQFEIKDAFIYGIEPLYILLTALCKEISDEFFVVQLFQAILLNYSVVRFAYKYSSNPFLSLLFYVSVVALYFNTEIIRESIAISLFLLNYENLLKKKWTRYYAIASISVLFHMSALITFLLPLAKRIEYNKKFPLFIFVFVIVGVPIGELISGYLDFDIFGGRIEKYMNIEERKGLNIYWTIFEVIKFAFLPLFALFCGHKIRYKSILEPMVCVNLLLGLGCVFFKLIFVRFANYVTIFFLVYSANVVSLYFSKRKYPYYRSKMIAFIFLFSLFVVYFRYHIGRWDNWYPYYSIFDNNKEEVKRLPRYFE